MIGGVMKYFRLGYREALYDISYSNIVLLSAAIPDYGGGNGKDGDTISADDPSNNAMIEKLLG